MAQTVANAGPDQEVASGATVTLDGSGSMDSGGSILGYRWIIGSVSAPHVPGFGTKDGKVVSFTAPILDPGAEDVEIFFSLLVTGSVGGTAKDTVTITVEAPNRPPVACGNGGTIPYGETIASGAPYTLDGSCSTDPDGDEEIDTYIWRYPAGYNGETDKAAGLMETAPVLAPGADDVEVVYTLIVVDDHDARSEPVTVTFTVTSPIAVPNAVAVTAESEYASGATVTLDGSGSSVDRRRGPIAYTWARTSGPGGSVTLSDPSAEQPTFTADTLEAGAEDVTHTFTLTVTDSDNKTDTDTVEITVEAPNAPPVADAGPDQTVASGAMVELDGSGSDDPDGSIKFYEWRRTGGSAAANPPLALFDFDTTRPYFTAATLTAGDVDRTVIFTLTVTDDDDAEATDTVTITVTSPFADPVADAGDPQTVAPGATVTLDGSGSTVDRRRTISSWAWTRTGGTGGPVNLSDASAELPSFTADTLAPGAEDVTHTFTLTVTDSAGKTDTDTVMVTIAIPNKPPVADAGPDQTVASGAMVELDGSGSDDPDGSIKFYEWRRTGGSAAANPPLALFDFDTTRPYFTAATLTAGDVDRTVIFTLTVTDDDDAEATDTVTITVTSPFADPVADAGDPQTVAPGATVTLDGSGSTVDRRRTISSWAWTRTGGTGGPVNLSDASAELPSFTADTLAPGAEDVTHTFTLTVTDSDGDSAEDMVTITVEAPNADPVAEAGPEQRLVRGDTVTLDGSGSMDPDALTGETLKYSWLRATGADEGSGDPVILSDPAIAGPTFTAETPDAGAADDTYVFTLTVTDVDEASHADTVTITVNAPPKAHAGPDRTYGSAAPVTLDGSGSSDTTGTFTYAWARTEGADSGDAAAVTLAGANTASPTFTAETLASGAPDVSYGFTLTVTDADGIEATNTVKITVTSGNVPPVAEAGPNQRLKTGGTVTLDGSGSMDPDALAGETLTYGWLRATGADEGSGDPVTLSNPAIAGPTFTAETPDAGAADDTYGFTLTVTDADSETHADTVKITVNAPPKADAGDDLMQDSGTLVTLDGSGSSDTTIAVGNRLAPVPPHRSPHAR